MYSIAKCQCGNLYKIFAYTIENQMVCPDCREKVVSSSEELTKEKTVAKDRINEIMKELQEKTSQ